MMTPFKGSPGLATAETAPTDPIRVPVATIARTNIFFAIFIVSSP